VQMGDWLHFPLHLLSGKKPLYTFYRRLVCSVWGFQGKEKSFGPIGIRIPDRRLNLQQLYYSAR